MSVSFVVFIWSHVYKLSCETASMKLHFPVSFYKGSDKTIFRINNIAKIYRNKRYWDNGDKRRRKTWKSSFERASNGYLSETSLRGWFYLLKFCDVLICKDEEVKWSIWAANGDYGNIFLRLF